MATFTVNLVQATLAEYQQVKSAAQNNPNASNLSFDDSTHTLTVTITE